MKNVIITGASGMIGGLVLESCLTSEDVKSVTSIVRRPTGIHHPKLKEVVHDDFTNFGTLAEAFREIDVAYYCLGAYTGSVPDEQFKRITVDFTVAFVSVLQAESPTATFCFLSGQGADVSEKSRMAFARYKGMAENDLVAREFGQLYIFRPGYIYPVQKRKEPNVMYRFFRVLFPLIRKVNRTFGVTSEELSQAMFKRGFSNRELVTLENVDIHNILTE